MQGGAQVPGQGGSRGLLGDMRILDLADEKGQFCGKVLADMGAEVIKVEPPGGDLTRNIGPFYRTKDGAMLSLIWEALNANKKGITLDLERDKAAFIDLVKTADVVVESFAPNHMDSLGLGYSVLSGVNPQMILVSISPFGQDGPYASYRASDLVLMAMGGFVFVNGDPDRAPVSISVPQAYFHAGSEAAVGTLLAYYYRLLTGQGQHIDVSVQECITPTVINAPRYWDLSGIIPTRVGPYWYRASKKGPLPYRLHWKCKDGYVSFWIQGGAQGANFMNPLVQWMDAEVMADVVKDIDWLTFDFEQQSEKNMRQIELSIGRFFAKHTKAELYNGGVERNIGIFPVFTTEDIANYEQLLARDFWTVMEHPKLGERITYPGPFAKLSEALIGVRRPAPDIGEHNDEIILRRAKRDSDMRR